MDRRDIVSREYRIFVEEERLRTLPRSLYEKMCRAAGTLGITPGKAAAKKIQDAADFSHLKVTPRGVASLTVLAALLIFVPTLLLVAAGRLSVGYAELVAVLALPFIYYLYVYPFHLRRRYEMQAGSEIVTMVLYITMYMRNIPNLENAIRFASENLTGNLGLELRKLLWDVEVGNYVNIEDALLVYAKKWQGNKAFVASIELIIGSLRQLGEQRIQTLSEAVENILQGNREDAKHFNQNLKTPVMMVHAMGVILPVLGLVMFPLIAVFLNVGATVLFIGYDVLLPIFLYFFISGILEKRPATFSRIDISENPDLPAPGAFLAGKRNVPVWPLSLVAGGSIIALGAYLAALDPKGILAALVIVFGIVAGFAIHYYLLTYQRIRVRDVTRAIEEEFAEALLQLGNRIYTGIPVEISIEQSAKRIKTQKIKEFFEKALNNMKTMGMTFANAFFDREYGAIRYYPSRTIKTVMRVVVEASQRGSKTVSLAMLSIAKYLKGIHDTQEEVKDELSDPLSSMKFQAFFLSPLISGVVITLTILMLNIIQELVARVGDLPSVPLLSQFQQIAITPFEFVLIVGVYVIETAFILGYFINGIENGEDDIGRKSITGYALFVGFIIFMVTLFVTLMIFSPLTLAVIPF